MKDKKIVIAGGTGFLGQAIAKYFGKDNHIVILSRQFINGQNNKLKQKLATVNDGLNITYWRWDGCHIEKHWAQEIDGCDIVINLAGKSVNCRYTAKNKEEITSSRVNTTNAIGDAIRLATDPPSLWINAASATIYPHAEDKPQDEFTGDFENDFSVQVCKSWEQAFNNERTPFTRKITLRMAIVLGRGGVMKPYLNLLKFGLGGHQGSGRQMYSWVHVEDVCRSIEWMFNNKQLEGIFNCSSPNPVNNKEFMKTLRRAANRNFGLPAPKWLLKLGAWCIGTEAELVLKSRWVLPTKLVNTGFEFKYRELEKALKAIIRDTPGNEFCQHNNAEFKSPVNSIPAPSTHPY